MHFSYFHKNRLFSKTLSVFLIISFLVTLVMPSITAHAQGLPDLPAAGTFVNPGPSFTPTIVRGLTLHPENPLRFDFIIDTGDAGMDGEAFKQESTRLIKYFLTSLTTPEDELWVNLSPYENNRIIPESFGQTNMGADLLSQDYILKQLTASLMYPEKDLGRKFWDRVYDKAQKKYGTTDIPMDTFNKVWIVPEKAVVYENGQSVFVIETHLKVMLEQDFIASKAAKDIGSQPTDNGPQSFNVQAEASEVIREVLLPEIEKEVNEGKNFAPLRQIINSMVLAMWYKGALKQSLLGQVYVDKNKTRGVDALDKDAKSRIYNQYLEAFKKGVYNYIREDYDHYTQETVARKYVSGGFKTHTDMAMMTDVVQRSKLSGDFRSLPVSVQQRTLTPKGKDVQVTWDAVDLTPGDHAMASGVALVGKPRVAQIQDLMARLKIEWRKKGGGNLPKIAVISDYHGEVKLFLDYIADIISQEISKKVTLDAEAFPQKSMTSQLEEQGVDLKTIDVTFYLLGDFLDRGDFGVKSFLVAKELIDEGKGFYVTGNHDLWAFMNLMGFHLPVYKGYNYYGHEKSAKLVEAHWDDADIVNDRVGWWTGKLAQYNEAQKKLQDAIFDGNAKDIRARLKENYLKIRDQLTEEEKALWRDLVGYYFETTDVYTGLNAVGMMSADWWNERLIKVRSMLEKGTQAEVEPAELSFFKELEGYTAIAANIVNERLNQAMERGDWWWQIFNDINHQNYTSVEWWGKDWSSHSGWGTSVIKEINLLEGSSYWNQSNYINNPHLKALADFYRSNFTLFRRDIYGNTYSHGWLPVDSKTGAITFSYKGRQYSGADIWEGLELIQNDVRDMTKPLSELYEALFLVNSWYADGTTIIKPKNVSHNVYELGLEKIFSQHGLRVWLTGHNPQNTLRLEGVPFRVKQGDYVLANVDKGLSWKKFSDAGASVLVNEDGINMRGYSGPDFREIVDNPDTLTIKGEGDGRFVVKKSWPNVGLRREDFLRITEVQLNEELARLSAPTSPDAAQKETPVGGIDLNPVMLNFQIKRNGQGVPLPVSDQPVQALKIDGFAPVIINVTPINVQMLLGVKAEVKEPGINVSLNFRSSIRGGRGGKTLPRELVALLN
ncbi:MAG: metallophosphoesterase [Candidatus Omnitrophica bacterium]|nr:metallophosphoesterase [Candidatus Omnitrophota bacterium]